MRTTLEIDDVVLAAARSRAAARGISLGKAVSELALRGLLPAAPTDQPAGLADVSYAPFPVFIDGPLVTDELVAAHRDE